MAELPLDHPIRSPCNSDSCNYRAGFPGDTKGWQSFAQNRLVRDGTYFYLGVQGGFRPSGTQGPNMSSDLKNERWGVWGKAFCQVESHQQKNQGWKPLRQVNGREAAPKGTREAGRAASPANAGLSGGRQEHGRAGRERDRGSGGEKQGQPQGAEPGLQARVDCARAQVSGRQAVRREGDGAGPHLEGWGTATARLGRRAHPPACRLLTRGQLFSKHWKCKLCRGNSHRSHVAIHPRVYFERRDSEIVCDTLHLLSSAKTYKEKQLKPRGKFIAAMLTKCCLL